MKCSSIGKLKGLVRVEATIRSTPSNRQGQTRGRIIWKTTPKEALQKCLFVQRPIIQILSHTGSMTRQLENLVHSCLIVDRTSVADLELVLSLDEASSSIEPCIERQILLRSSTSHHPVLYAHSWWNPMTFRDVMTDPERPVWYNLRKNEIQTSCHIRGIFALDAPELRTRLGEPDENAGWLLGREYTLEAEDRRICSLVEVVPNALRHYVLPPSSPLTT